jgi:hypothetical protein
MIVPVVTAVSSTYGQLLLSSIIVIMLPKSPGTHNHTDTHAAQEHSCSVTVAGSGIVPSDKFLH